MSTTKGIYSQEQRQKDVVREACGRKIETSVIDASFTKTIIIPFAKYQYKYLAAKLRKEDGEEKFHLTVCPGEQVCGQGYTSSSPSLSLVSINQPPEQPSEINSYEGHKAHDYWAPPLLIRFTVSSLSVFFNGAECLSVCLGQDDRSAAGFHKQRE